LDLSVSSMYDGKVRKPYLEGLQGWELSNCVCNPSVGFVYQRAIPTLIRDIVWGGVREEARIDCTAASKHSRSLVWHSVFRRERL
jgi:hypothetical protein